MLAVGPFAVGDALLWRSQLTGRMLPVATDETEPDALQALVAARMGSNARDRQVIGAVAPRPGDCCERAGLVAHAFG